MLLQRLSTELFHLRLLVFRLAMLYLVMAFCRFVFYIYNQEAFVGLAWSEFIMIFIYALRFDTSAIFYVNILFIATHLLPLPWRSRAWYTKIQKAIFYCCNLPMLFLEMSDIVYFPYAFRRIVRSDFGMQQDIKNLLPQFLSDFWWLVLLFILVVIFFEWAWRKSRRVQIAPTSFLYQLVFFLMGTGLLIIGLRGGLQLRPLMPQSAAMYVSDTRYMPLVSNTTLGLLQSFQQKSLQAVRYYEDEQGLNAQFNIHKTGNVGDTLRRLNVVFLVVESFGCEYLGYFHPERKPSHTPFFDSLLHKGLIFNNMFANGTRSTQGIVAITGGLPALMSDPFMFSSYQTNALMGLGNLLAAEGYTTAFFHGGEVGTMDFDKFAPLVGFQHYHGRQQYIANNKIPTNQDYDGNWGIWDIPFYDYALRQINQYPEPFFVNFFSINPHHPFSVPPDFEQQHPDLPPLWRAVRYADTALASFFAKAQQQPWFQRTLFVITADHIGPIQTPAYNQRVARYRIPLLLFCPSDSLLRGIRHDITQQIDILPTTLSYLHYPKPYLAFGQNKLDTNQRLSLSYTYESDIYQLVNQDFALQFDGTNAVALFEHPRDSFLKNNLLGQRPDIQTSMEQQLKAIIQTHHRVLLNNEFRNVK